jgi:NAD(P)-dependent dehydrogenase (short-subunit alcohol dehydrogenase family)
MNRLKSITAIVTGGAVGIGRACVIRMAEEGAKVAIFDLLEAEGKALAADLVAKGHEVAFWPVDVADEVGMKSAIDAAAVRFGGKHAIPHLRAAGKGSIINLSSIAGLIGIGGIAPYHAKKGAVRLMSKNDAITHAPEKIRVNSIHPADIWTPMVENHLRATAPDLEAAKAAAGAAHPIGTMGEPDDIAWAVVWLASDEAKFVTGTENVIHGGYTAR